MGMGGDGGCGRVEEALPVGPAHGPELLRRHAGLTAHERGVKHMDQSQVCPDRRGESGRHLQGVRGTLTAVDGNEDALESLVSLGSGGRVQEKLGRLDFDRPRTRAGGEALLPGLDRDLHAHRAAEIPERIPRRLVVWI